MWHELGRTLTQVEEHKGLVVLPFASQTKFRTWLRKNHARQDGFWLKFAKKASGIASVTYAEAREEAIAWGWIDGLKNGYDESYYLLRFTPRRPRSKWSQINRSIAEALIERGAMQPTGMAEVEAARADGRWDRAYPSASKMEVHPDLAKALKANADARAAFDALDGANRYAVLYRVWDAATDASRTRRINDLVGMLARGETIHPAAKRKTSKKKTAKKKTAKKKTTKKKTAKKR